MDKTYLFATGLVDSEGNPDVIALTNSADSLAEAVAEILVKISEDGEACVFESECMMKSNFKDFSQTTFVANFCTTLHEHNVSMDELFVKALITMDAKLYRFFFNQFFKKLSGELRLCMMVSKEKEKKDE